MRQRERERKEGMREKKKQDRRKKKNEGKVPYIYTEKQGTVIDSESAKKKICFSGGVYEWCHCWLVAERLKGTF